MKKLISIVGTTGIGKTSLSISLAQHLGTEIVSCDSRQFFKEMKIGTAAPSDDELNSIPHHFIGHLSVTEDYSVGQFELDALEKLNQLFRKTNTVVLVGGSMMYEKAIIEGLNDLPEANEKNQSQLKEILENEGIEALQLLLKKLDEDYYCNVDLNNPRRLLRALDVIWQTQQKYSDLIATPTKKRDFEVIRIGIEAPRSLIYERINKRVDIMLANGLLEEVKTLIPHQHLTSLKTVGYTELFNYFTKDWTLDFAIEEIKKNSRRYAKRQLTWYRKEENIHWVNFENSEKEALSLLSHLL